jgi:hypothetical protein
MRNKEIALALGRTEAAVNVVAWKLGLRKSAAFMKSPACRFPKGNRPWNTGMTGWQPKGSERTQFKKGHRSARQKPVGTERSWKDDGIQVKVAEPNVWMRKARYVWEQHFGPIPEGGVVRLKKRDDYSPDNLELICRSENARRNAGIRRKRVKRTPLWVRPLLEMRVCR